MSLRFLLADQLSFLRDEGYEVSAISAPGPWVADLSARGIRHIAWPSATRSWAPRSDLKALTQLYRILERERFDLVHTHNPKPGILGRWCARFARVPVVVNTVHGLYALPSDRWPKKLSVLALEAAAARAGDLELYQSEEDLMWARRLHVVPENKSAFLGNGIDLRAFDPQAVDAGRVAAIRSEWGVGPDGIAVGTLGRLVVDKGIREFCAAASLVRSGHPEGVFVAIGAPDPEKAGSFTDADAALQEDVLFAGWRTDVRDVLAALDVFVLASYREGLPRSAIEAAAMAKPLVVTDIRGCREVAHAGIEGLLVPPRNAGALAAAIAELVDDDAARARMGAAARQRAVERFDQERVHERIAAAYRELLGSRGLAPLRAQPVEIRAARVADGRAIADLHRTGLPDAFLPRLGDRFLRLLYRSLVRDPEAVVLVALDPDVIGFVAGVPSVPRFYRRFLRRYGVLAGISALGALMRRGALRAARETAGQQRSPERRAEAELLSIAVSAGHRGRGIGHALVSELLDELGAAGVREVQVVVGSGNSEANDLYAAAGGRMVERLSVHRGVTSNLWVIPCPSSSVSRSA